MVWDRLDITYGRNKLKIGVLRFAEAIRADEVDTLYKIIKKISMREDD